jgi:hypothetical protein
LERKNGNIGKLDYGKLSAAAAKKVGANLLAIMKGKKKLAKLRTVFQSLYGSKFDVQRATNQPINRELVAIAAKYFRDAPGQR